MASHLFQCCGTTRPLLLVSCFLFVLLLGLTSVTRTTHAFSATVRRQPPQQQQLHDTECVGTVGFHHVEFYCGDAKSTATRFSLALGLPITCVTHQGTGNDRCCSYGLASGEVRFLFTAPYSRQVVASSGDTSPSDDDLLKFDAPLPLPSFHVDDAHDFFQRHGIGARAVGIEVEDVRRAFDTATDRGAVGVLEPHYVASCRGQTTSTRGCEMAEVELYGDVVLRLLQFDHDNENENDDTATHSHPFLPHLAPLPHDPTRTYGLRRIDHAVGNVPDLRAALDRIQTMTGFHEFAEFTSSDVGTVDSGLNSVVLASDSERILLPLNEPVAGTRKSQIQTFLEQNEGAGLQHLALKTDDIFHTITHMRRAEEELGGFELMKRPSDNYYRELPERLGELLTTDQYRRVEELGILADADDEGILLQIFTKPVGDRPTFFVEIIQRIGCVLSQDDSNDSEDTFAERPGCGGFGQGNFKELFKAIEDHEKTLKI